ncbi:MAG: CDP-diacylglycerol--glycerol-3-phosphate 3-phosphatidyltransferase, partial [Lentisphaeria bacterium]|nr:CDP-diacylglycerol--glycerol-3-phosphate 3-phosphatidyltransferase [Lentisphaeria bacterium]
MSINSETGKFKDLPNILTISRIVAIAVFVVLASLADYSYFRNRDSVTLLRLIAYVLALLAGVTDLVDGYIARRFNAISDFGALMDPLADKIFVTGCMLMAIQYKLMPAWIAIAVLCREFMVTGLRTLAAKKQVVISADRWGKVKTASQMIMLGIAGAAWVIDGGTAYLREAKWFGVSLWCIWYGYLVAIVLVTALSGLNYFIRYR